MDIKSIHLLLQQKTARLFLKIITIIYNDASCWQSFFSFVMMVMVGSVFDPMADDLFGRCVGSVDSVVAGEGE